jgi:methionine-R-sulfoxide reductase
MRKILIITLVGFVICLIANTIKNSKYIMPSYNKKKSPHVIAGSFDQSKLKTESEWKKILTSEQYHILREAGTETPFTGALEHESRIGVYYSVGCNEPVFRSETKFDSGTGWPSFYDPITSDALVLQKDTTIPYEERIEVLDKCVRGLGENSLLVLALEQFAQKVPKWTLCSVQGSFMVYNKDV